MSFGFLQPPSIPLLPLGGKAAWAQLIVALPLVGLGVWGVAGPRGIKRPDVAMQTRSSPVNLA
ncbi:hypothetical protein AAZU54_04985 [Pseudomonas sp. Je.1.5.c]|nr:hypothetical protein [Pseudomonas sp. CM25]